MANIEIKFHKGLTHEQWAKNNVFEIMGNIGSEVSRTIKWKSKGKEVMWKAAFDRSLELFDISKEVNTLSSGQKSELHRAREVWVDFIFGDNEYHSQADSLQRYFDQYVIAQRNLSN